MAALRSTGKQLAIVFSLLMAAPAMGADQQPKLPQTIPVELWNGSAHDIFTSSLFNAMADAYQNSGLFIPSYEKKDHTLVVTLPNAVKRRTEGGRTEITYLVEFSTIRDEKLATATGSCWIDDYTKCAGQILKESRTVALKIK